MDDDVIVTLADYDATPNTCHKGGRHFCREHGLDWDAFRQHGIPASLLAQFDDAIVKAAIATTKRRYAAEAAREAGTA